METQKKMKAGEEEDRLSDLPDPMLIHILSMLQNGKEVLRTSVLSKRWRFLWKSVPISLDFYFPEDDPYFGLPVSGEKEALDFVASTHRELHYWSHCATKIKKINLMVNFSKSDRFAKDVDFWVYFATKIANVEDFTLDCISGYEFPKFAYNNASLKNLAIQYCELDPSVSVNWSSLVSLSIGQTDLTGNFMEKVLSGCPNLESLQLEFFRGFHSLEISNVKLRKLTITGFDSDERDVWLEILAPCIQELQLLGSSCGIRLKNVASLVTAVLYLDLELDFGVEEKSEKKELCCLKELLHSVAHVKNLELGPWFVKCISTLALEGWQSQPSSSKFLKLHTNFEELDFPGISSFLQSSPHLETLVIDWRPYLFPRYVKDKERKIRRFETHKFNCALLHLSLLHLPLLHLKTIKFINLDGPLSENKFVLPLVKYFLENAIVLEKFDMAARCKGSAVPVDEIKIEQELLSFPRSSLRASLVFSDQ